jgi:AcrR family transcriptional regulator
MSADQTRGRLIFTAMKIFAAQDYDGASTPDICSPAAISYASIHYQFGNNAMIYSELCERLLDEFEQRLRGSGMDPLSGRAALLALYQAELQPLAENPGLAQQVHLYLREEFQPSGPVDDLLPRDFQIKMELLGGLLRC